MVGIVGDDNPLGDGSLCTSRMQAFDKLGSLGSWGSTHIKNKVIGLHIKEKRRDHTDSLLSVQNAVLVIVHDLSPEFRKSWDLLQLGLCCIEVPAKVIGVPGQRSRWGYNLYNKEGTGAK
jgi:hypothetical protein